MSTVTVWERRKWQGTVRIQAQYSQQRGGIAMLVCFSIQGGPLPADALCRQPIPPDSFPLESHRPAGFSQSASL